MTLLGTGLSTSFAVDFTALRTSSSKERTMPWPSQPRQPTTDKLLASYKRAYTSAPPSPPNATTTQKAPLAITATMQPPSPSQHLRQASLINRLQNLNVLQALPTIGSLNLSDLATITGTHGSSLEPLMRAAVSSGCILQTTRGEYAHSPLSLAQTRGGEAVLDLCNGWCDQDRNPQLSAPSMVGHLW